MRFSWSLGASPRQPTVVWSRRDTPPADRASGAKQRRCTAVTIQLIDRAAAVCCRGQHFEVRKHALFRCGNLMTQVDLGHRILESKKIRSDSAYSDWIRPVLMQSETWNKKAGFRSETKNGDLMQLKKRVRFQSNFFRFVFSTGLDSREN